MANILAVHAAHSGCHGHEALHTADILEVRDVGEDATALQ